MCSRVLGIGGLDMEGSFKSLCSNTVFGCSSDRKEFLRISSGSGLELFTKNCLSEADLKNLSILSFN